MDTKILTKILNKEKDIPIYVMAQQSFTGEYDYVLCRDLEVEKNAILDMEDFDNERVYLESNSDSAIEKIEEALYLEKIEAGIYIENEDYPVDELENEAQEIFDNLSREECLIIWADF